MRVFSCRACPLVSFRCSRRRFLYGGRVVMAMWASSAVSSSFSLPYASLRYWINFVSLAFGSAIYLDASLGFGRLRTRSKAVEPHTTSSGYRAMHEHWDDDDWTGKPPEGHHSASRANPGFWAQNRDAAQHHRGRRRDRADHPRSSSGCCDRRARSGGPRRAQPRRRDARPPPGAAAGAAPRSLTARRPLAAVSERGALGIAADASEPRAPSNRARPRARRARPAEPDRERREREPPARRRQGLRRRPDRRRHARGLPRLGRGRGRAGLRVPLDRHPRAARVRRRRHADPGDRRLGAPGDAGPRASGRPARRPPAR